MAKHRIVWALVAALAALGCGGGQSKASSPDAEQGVTESAGEKLGEAADGVKATGDQVGQEVGKSFGKASRKVKETLGDEPHAPPPKLATKENE